MQPVNRIPLPEPEETVAPPPVILPGKRPRNVCTLPCDSLDEQQLEALNGPVSRWDLSTPMPFCRFRTMPEDLQKLYYRRMQNALRKEAAL